MRKTTMVAVLCAVALVVGGTVAVALQGNSEAKKPPVSPQTGEITFNTQSHVFGTDKESYEVPAGHQLVLTLTLDVQGPGAAAFATPPVTFPHGDPPDFHWRKVSDTEIVLTELNNNSTPGKNEEYCFKARVTSGGDTYESPDPTIVNLGPPAP